MPHNNGDTYLQDIYPTVDWDKRRAELEAIVAPYVTTKKTGNLIWFKGKRRYEKSIPIPQLVIHAEFALCAIYAIEAAREAGDIELAIAGAMIFAGQELMINVQNDLGVCPIAAAYNYRDTKTSRRNTRLGKTKLRDVPDLILQVAYAKHAAKNDWLKCVTEDVVRHRGGAVVSSKKVSEELKKRGIAE